MQDRTDLRGHRRGSQGRRMAHARAAAAAVLHAVARRGLRRGDRRRRCGLNAGARAPGPRPRRPAAPGARRPPGASANGRDDRWYPVGRPRCGGARFPVAAAHPGRVRRAANTGARPAGLLGCPAGRGPAAERPGDTALAPHGTRSPARRRGFVRVRRHRLPVHMVATGGPGTASACGRQVSDLAARDPPLAHASGLCHLAPPPALDSLFLATDNAMVSEASRDGVPGREYLT